MILSMAPLYILFEFSLVMARRFGRPPDGGFEDDEPDDEPGDDAADAA